MAHTPTTPLILSSADQTNIFIALEAKENADRARGDEDKAKYWTQLRFTLADYWRGEGTIRREVV